MKTKKGRLSREWEVVKVIDSDGEIYNFPMTVAGYSYGLEMEFAKNGDFTFTYSYSDPGEPTQFDVYDGGWDFSSDKEDLEVEFDGTRHNWQILRLTSKELWFEDEDRAEWHLEAK